MKLIPALLLLSVASLAHAETVPLPRPRPVMGISTFWAIDDTTETNGSTEIKAVYGDKVAKLTVNTDSCDVNLPINFANQIVPIFTKLGCNSGGCHGKSGGQNGFALSLLGFVPELDFQTLVKEDRGRRLLPAAPDSSLLLLKATGQVQHGGQTRFGKGSWAYEVLRTWITQGAQWKPGSGEARVVRATPAEYAFARPGLEGQLRIEAEFTDGSKEDVTPFCEFRSNDDSVVEIAGFGGGSPYLLFRYAVATKTISGAFYVSSPQAGPRVVSLSDDGSLASMAWWLSDEIGRAHV